MGLFSKKPKSMIVQQPADKAAAEAAAMDRLEELLPMVETLPQLASPPRLDPPAKGAKPAKPPKPPKQNRKTTVDPTDLLALRSELKEMRARLDESEQTRAIVEARLSSLDAATSAFATERNDITEVANMVVQLQQQVAERSNENGSNGPTSYVDDANDGLSANAGVEALHERVGQLTEQPRGADDDIRLQLQEIGERLRNSEELQAQVAQLLERAGSNDTEARAVREHMALLDQRLTNVSTELANQLSELGRDIDGLGQRASEVANGAVSDEVVDALRGGQVKLANEQARYEIAFREDLAALAEQLRRGRPAS